MNQCGGVVRSITAAILGSGVFFGSMIMLETDLVLSAGMALVTFAGVSLLARKKKKPKGYNLKISGVEGEERIEALRVVQDGYDRVNKIKSIAGGIRNRVLMVKIGQVCETAVKILDDFRDDPRDIRQGKRTFKYLMDTTETIVTKAADLDRRGLRGQRIIEVMRRIDGTLDQIIESMNRLLIKLVENDLMELDTEISVLEKTIKLEDM